MKSIILVYVLYLLYHPSRGDYQQLFEIVEREHPKKANLLTDFRHLQYLNPVKVITKKPYYRRFGGPGNVYTLFPPVESRRVGVPDSPYFPLDKNMEARSRVKKIMADVPLRYKRSPINQKSVKLDTLKAASPLTGDQDKSTDDIKIKKEATTVEPKEIKPKSKKKTRVSAQRSNNKPKTQRNKKPKTGSKHGNKRERKRKPRNENNGKEDAKKPKDSEKSARRIIAGRDADISRFPYVISIQKDGQHWCAGALLNPAMFISTANCFWKGNRVTRMTIRAGSSYVDRGGRVARIQQIMKHPAWSVRSEPDNDVALGLLDRKLRFTDELHSVDIPNHAMMPPFDDVFVTSWGAIRSDGFYEQGKGQNLQTYRANIMDLATCKVMTSRYGVIVTNNFFCLDQMGGSAPCTADTGAPAVNDGVLWGLASWGLRKKCGTERYPAMFSFVGSKSNLYFITNATRLFMTDERIYPFLDRQSVDTTTIVNLRSGSNMTDATTTAVVLDDAADTVEIL